MNRKNTYLLSMITAAVVQPGVAETETNILVSGTKRILQLEIEKHKTLIF